MAYLRSGLTLSWLVLGACGLGVGAPGDPQNVTDDDGGDDDGGDGDDDAPSDSDSDGEIPDQPTGCVALDIAHGENVSGYLSELYAWSDADCRPRTAAMVRNDQQDPAGRNGGYMRRYTYQVNGVTRTCEGAHPYHPGFGLMVNHYGDTAAISTDYAGEGRVALAGRHHAIHEYTWTYPISGHDVSITAHWLFATGRDNPLWAVTFDSSGAAANAVSADTRSPYGDIAWDGGAGVNVDGVGWGDRYKFISKGSPITLNNGWDYSAPNTVPYVIEWANGVDAEMGLVQTQTYLQHDAGGYWFYGSWGQHDDDGPMPQDWNWPYQLNQYELPFGSTSKRMAWGANYGAVGSTYNLYGDDGTTSGYPYQSYSVYIVLGQHSRQAVLSQVTQVEREQSAHLAASTGHVRTSGPAGLGRSDNITYAPIGRNPIYGTWELEAAGGKLDATLGNTTGLVAPIFVVHGMQSAPTQVTVNGAPLTADTGYYATLDEAHDALWLTLPGSWSGTVRLELE